MKIIERFITAKNGNDEKDLEIKERYFDRVIEILKKSYAPIGGLKSLDQDEEILRPEYIWKLVKRNNDITAVALYKGNMQDRKLVLIGRDADLDPQAKEDLYSLIQEDIRRTERYVWGEVSGALEHIFVDKFKANTVTTKDSYSINKKLGKNIEPIDNYHYNRKIGNDTITKRIVGNVPKKYLDDDVDSPLLDNHRTN